jgi:hypothetical protein
MPATATSGTPETLNAFETGFIPGTITIGDGGLLRWTLANLSETGAGVNFDQIGLGTNANLLYETGARFVFDFAAFGDGPEVTDAFLALGSFVGVYHGRHGDGGRRTCFLT